MERRKNIIFLILSCSLTLAVLSFCGCSGGSAMPFSSTISGEEVRIWYECQNKIEKTNEDGEQYIIEDVEDEENTSLPTYGRETQVVWIKVYKDGNVTSYSCLGDVNLGHFSKMTDEEILEELETDTDTYLCGQKDQKAEIYLYTDAAGQEVLFEGVPALIKQKKDGTPMYFMTLVSKEQVDAFQVYDSYYGGFELYNYDEKLFGQAVLVTRCNKGAKFSLDSMELEGAILDYKTPEEMLHEKNLEYATGDDKKTESAEESENAESAEGAEGESGESKESAQG